MGGVIVLMVLCVFLYELVQKMNDGSALNWFTAKTDKIIDYIDNLIGG